MQNRFGASGDDFAAVELFAVRAAETFFIADLLMADVSCPSISELSLSVEPAPT